MKTIFGQKCVIYDKSTRKILLLKRSDYKGDKDSWDMVGGSVDIGEDSKESIIREAYEETQIKIKDPLIIDLHSRMVSDDMFFIFGLYLWDDYSGEEIKLSSEHTEYKWVEPKELDNYLLRNSIDYVKEIIKNYSYNS